jgi:hypothetical protein
MPPTWITICLPRARNAASMRSTGEGGSSRIVGRRRRWESLATAPIRPCECRKTGTPVYRGLRRLERDSVDRFAQSLPPFDRRWMGMRSAVDEPTICQRMPQLDKTAILLFRRVLPPTVTGSGAYPSPAVVPQGVTGRLSAAVIARPRIAATSAIIIRTCSTEYSVFDGTARSRCRYGEKSTHHTSPDVDGRRS